MSKLKAILLVLVTSWLIIGSSFLVKYNAQNCDTNNIEHNSSSAENDLRKPLIKCLSDN